MQVMLLRSATPFGHLAGAQEAIPAVEQAGNDGLTRKYPLERHYRDVLCAQVHTPQDDAILAAAGWAALAAVTATAP